jgi:hypothetical protein
MQVPPAPIHVWHDPHDCVQQRLSMQLPEAQSFAMLQVPPLLILHDWLTSQMLAPAQIVPVVSSALATPRLQNPSLPQLWHAGQVLCAQQTPSRQVSPL